MRRLIYIFLFVYARMGVHAQTPFDSFSPETSRPMLELEVTPAVDTVLCADVKILPTIDNVSKWLSVDPLADKYPNISPYAYCAWNPINAIDPNGEEWTDVDGNVIQDHTNIKAYIFYNKDEFSSQTMQMYADLEAKYGKGSVAISDVRTTKDFKQDWQNMSSGIIQEVNINHHGNNQTIILDNNQRSPQYITSTGNGRTNVFGNPALNVQDLGKPIGTIDNARLNLHTCRSNSTTQNPLQGSGLTLMQSFYNVFLFKEVKGTSAGVSYNRFTQRPEPQFFWQSWDYLKH